MAYGSHHFLTGFKFQCESREAFLFGPTIYDHPGVREALDGVHLLTSDAYSRNLSPLRIGDRAAILLTIEEWGKASARFCYRVISEQGKPVAVGFQTLLCADAKSGEPILMPPPLLAAMENNRAIEEPHAEESFRVRALAGGDKVASLIGPDEIATVLDFLDDRQPIAGILHRQKTQKGQTVSVVEQQPLAETEAWVFAGQGAFNAKLLATRVQWCREHGALSPDEIGRASETIAERLGVDARALFDGDADRCRAAVDATPDLSQPAIHLQNVLGARLLLASGRQPAVLIGQSFGEIAALETAGALDLPSGVAVVCERVRAVSEHAPASGGLLAAAVGRSIVVGDLVLLGLDGLSIAGRNHDRQTIVSGPADELDRLADYYKSAGFAAVRVPAPTSFHHPSLKHAAAAWADQLAGVPFEPIADRVYSPIGRRFVGADDDLRAMLASQLLTPFDLQGAVVDLIQSGITRFVDCGSTASLKSLLTKAAPEGTAVVGAEESLVATPQPHPTATAAPQNPPVADDEPAAEAPLPTAREPIAIVGQGCLLPGGASTPDDLYAAIMQQRSGLVDIRDEDPWWSEDFYSEELTADRSTTHLSGRVNVADIVCPSNVDQAVFDRFTRTQKLLCIALAPCVASLEGAERVLCLVGSTADGYEDQDTVASLRYAGLDPTDAVIDERFGVAASAGSEPHDAVQEVFDKVVRPGLRVVLVDAACASSLYTVALGVRAIHAGQADAVLAGGVFCPGPGNSCLFSQFRGTTATGLRPFDAGADGVIFSEGAAFVTLRAAADAERHGLPTEVTVLGEGISSDGRSSSANVPQTHGQILALQRCYDAYGIDPATINAIEAHGTSTPVGDATEIETLRQYFADHAPTPLPVHSLKGLLGHAGWAAGTASIIAACQYLRNGEFPGQAFFQSPNKALLQADGVLQTLADPQRLPAGERRIAIDGFGFGGANAHLVLECKSGAAPEPGARADATPHVADNLVLVGVSEITPTEQSASGKRFDRSQVKPPEGRFILPDLEDDLDISQLLTMRLVDDLRNQLGEPLEEVDRSTSIVLALAGKTERGVEATMRVLAPRLRRELGGNDQAIASVDRVADNSRPSGPYTLQAMMPNVSAGRSCLTYNLNGPNFVVDAGPRSLDEAFFSASMLLNGPTGSECSLAIVVAIDANPWRPRYASDAPHDEHAVAFAVTTRSEAERRGLPILGKAPASDADVSTSLEEVLALAGKASPKPATPRPVEEVAPLHRSVWVERAIESPSSFDTPYELPEGVVAVVADSESLVRDTVAYFEQTSDRWTVLVVGEASPDIVAAIGNPHVLASPHAADEATEGVLYHIKTLAPGWVVAIDTPSSWDLPPSLDGVASSCLTEHLFLIAQRLEDRLVDGSTRLSAAFLDAWEGFPHPVSGGAAGLLKSIGREFPGARPKVVCSRDRSLADVLNGLREEFAQHDGDTEIVHDGRGRLVRRFVPEGSQSEPATPPLGEHSVVIATGGARGVTAVMAEAVLEDIGCTVVALGRSELEAPPADLEDSELEAIFYRRFAEENPEATGAEAKRAYEKAFARWEAHKTAKQLAALPGQFEYLKADITDSESVDAAVAEVYRRFGRIDMVLHGAGVQFSKRLGRRTLDEFRMTMTVKLNGLRQVLRAIRSHSNAALPVHLLTSAFSIFGNDGQHDYGSANETLDRLAELATHNAGVKWTSIPWLAWDGVGMTRGSEYKSLARQRQLTPIDPPTGQAIFRRVVLGGAPGGVHVPIGEAERLAYLVHTVPADCHTRDARVAEVGLDLAKVSCLDQHVVRGVPTLPGAWTVDRMVDAALRLVDSDPTPATAILEDVRFSRFVRRIEGSQTEFRVVALPTDKGIRVWLLGDVTHPSGTTLSRDVVFASARVSFASSPCALSEGSPLASTDATRGPAAATSAIPDPYCTGAPTEVQLSGAFDCLSQIEITEQLRSASFRTRASHRDGNNVVPAYLLDALWRLGAMYAGPSERDLYVPVKIGRIECSLRWVDEADLREPIVLHSIAPLVGDSSARWAESVAMSANGQIAIVVRDASAARLEPKQHSPAPRSGPAGTNVASQQAARVH